MLGAWWCHKESVARGVLQGRQVRCPLATVKCCRSKKKPIHLPAASKNFSSLAWVDAAPTLPAMADNGYKIEVWMFGIGSRVGSNEGWDEKERRKKKRG